MRTITIEVPDEVVAILETRPLEERNQFAVAALKAGIELLDDAEGEEGAEILGPPLTPAEIVRRDIALKALSELGRSVTSKAQAVSLESMRRVNLYDEGR
jgi:hypothetical protein